MRRKRRFQRSHPPLGFNFTPLIDVMFLLTVFLMLVSRFTSAERAAMELPGPEESRARVSRLAERVVINCRLGESEDSSASVLYNIGPNPPEPLSAIGERIAAVKRESPGVKVVIRADRRLPYEPVRSLMRILARNNVETLHVAALAPENP